MDKNISGRIEQHKKYWNVNETQCHLFSCRLGDYFFADKFKAAKRLLKPGLEIEPSMFDIDDFLNDYERIFNEIEELGQSGFWCAEPFAAIPWMEAFLGCTVHAGSYSFTTEPYLDKIEDFNLKMGNILSSPWFSKYMEFVRRLVGLSKGRFPVAQPILRGCSDVLGAVTGQEKMIYEMYDNPVKTKQVIAFINSVFQEILERQYRLIPDFYGGYSIGFYHLWTPGKCAWFQEDLSALLSPALYKSMIKEYNAEICSKYDYSLIHLHPSSFHILDDVIDIKDLKAIEINKDIGGPSIKEMLPILNKVARSGKRLVIWGMIDEDDIRLIKSELTDYPVFLSIVVENADCAVKIME